MILVMQFRNSNTAVVDMEEWLGMGCLPLPDLAACCLLRQSGWAKRRPAVECGACVGALLQLRRSSRQVQAPKQVGHDFFAEDHLHCHCCDSLEKNGHVCDGGKRAQSDLQFETQGIWRVSSYSH